MSSIFYAKLLYGYQPWIRNHFSKHHDHRVVILCSISFQERIMSADLLAVEEMKSLIMWSCSFRWVLFLVSPACPTEMGRIYTERMRPSTGVKTWLYTVGGMEDSEKGWCCSDVPWDGSSRQYVLKYFIALLFCLRSLFCQFSGGKHSIQNAHRSSPQHCTAVAALWVTSCWAVMQHSQHVLYQSSEWEQWCHSSSSFSVTGPDLCLPCPSQAQQ